MGWNRKNLFNNAGKSPRSLTKLSQSPIPKDSAQILPPDANLIMKEFIGYHCQKYHINWCSNHQKVPFFQVLEPNQNMDCLCHQSSSASRCFCQRCNKGLGQAFLDGKKAVIPLWVLQFWNKMHWIVFAQAWWMKGLSWIDNNIKARVGASSTVPIRPNLHVTCHRGKPSFFFYSS